MSIAMVLWALVAPATACSPPVTGAWEIVPHTGDDVAPLAPELDSVSVWRGRGWSPNPLAGLMDCYPRRYGEFSLNLAQAGEPRDGEDTGDHDGYGGPMGYRLRVVEGSLPEELEQDLTGTWTGGGWRDEDGVIHVTLHFPWFDPPRRQQPIAATIEVVPVDRAGNEGPPLLVDVEDAAGCGCAAAPGPRGWPLLLVTLGAARRRRPSRVCGRGPAPAG